MLKDHDRVYLLGMSGEELRGFSESLGQPGFRGKQIADWVYRLNAENIDQMTNLPSAFRERLKEEAVLYRAVVRGVSRSPDGTSKHLLEMEDGQLIEAVLLPYEDRLSVCVSTQVGCAAGCLFCATAIGGFARNLSAGEIVDEVLTLQKESARRVTHVVYMGMGEPLLNYESVLKSIHLLNDEVGIAMRHMTVSTVGITPRMERLAGENLQITLAVSLHAPNDDLRRRLIPLAERYPLQGLMDACRKYTAATRRRITFEYLLLRGVNDSLPLARELASLLKGIMCNVNLIPYNAVEGLALNRPAQSHVAAFRSVLERAGITVTQRQEKGESISAACGQLRRRERRR